MNKKYLKKIIAQSTKDLRLISAFCSESIVKLSEIKYLPKNKIFLVSIERINKEDQNEKKINSIIKFEYVESSKSKNINQNNINKVLELLAIDFFKRDNNYEINLLFSGNAIITLDVEIIEVTLEDQTKNDNENI